MSSRSAFELEPFWSAESLMPAAGTGTAATGLLLCSVKWATAVASPTPILTGSGGLVGSGGGGGGAVSLLAGDRTDSEAGGVFDASSVGAVLVGSSTGGGV